MSRSLHERLRVVALALLLCGGIGYAGVGVSDAAFDAPDALLIRAGDRAWYLVLADGGAAHLGAVLRRSPDGTSALLHEFRGYDGAHPNSALVQLSDGSFVGTTEGGGAHGLGTIYQIGADGVLLRTFAFEGSDGAQPEAGLVPGADGALFGTTKRGGAYDGGTMFRYDAAGSLTVLRSLEPEGVVPPPDPIFSDSFESPAPTITSANATTFTVGAVNTFSVTTTGNPTIQRSGALPSGVNFADNGNGTGTLSGTPGANTQASSPYPLTFTASNGNLPNAVQNFTLTVSCADITVSDPSVTLKYNTAVSGIQFMETGGHGTIAWSASGLPAGVSISPTTGVLSGTPTAVAPNSATITATDAFGCQGSRIKSLPVQPKLGDDSYNVVGNTQLVAAAQSAPTTPFTASATTLLANDTANVAIATTAGTFATTHGSITIDTAGKFTYTPNPGYVGSDDYTYAATANGVAGSGLITFTVSGMVWYVNNTYAGANGTADGRSHRPYTDMTAASAAAAANQILYVHTGSGDTAGTSTLKTGQQLVGNGSALSVGALSLAAGTPPTLAGSVVLNSSVTVKGLNISSAGAAGLTDGANTATAISVDVGQVASGAGVPLTLANGGSGNVAIGTATCANSAHAIYALNFAGSITVGSLTSNVTSGVGILLDHVTAATLSGTVNNIPLGGVALQLNSTALTVGASGPLALSNVLGVPVSGSDTIQVTGGTVSINGGTTGFQAINAAGGEALRATSGGTLTITGGPNTLQTAAGPNAPNPGLALQVGGGTTIGVGGLTFRSISSNGALNGINLGSTGTGSLTVTGNGGACAQDSDPCTGGSIVSSTGNGVVLESVGGAVSLNNMKIKSSAGDGIGGDGVASVNLSNLYLFGNAQFAGYDGIRLTSLSGSSTWTNLVVSNSGYDNVLVDQSAGKVSISNSTFSNAGQNGIEANGVAGLDLSSVTVSGNGNALNEEGIKLSNLSGSSTWTNLTVSNSFTDNVFIDQTSGTIASLAISGSTFSGAPQHGILLQPRGTTVVSSFTVSSSTFSNNASTGVFVSAADSANVAGAVVQTSTFTNNGVHIDFSKGQSASLQFKVLNNQTMTGAVSHAINVASGTDVTTGGFLKGRIENNKIGAAKAVGSTGSTSGDGIRVLAQAQTQGWVLINNNQIYQTPNAHGIQAFGRNGNPAPSGLDVTITNNDVDTGVDSNNASAVANALSAISVLADCATVCNHTRADISGNTVPSWAPGSDFVAGQLIVVQTGTPNPTPSIFDLVGTGANALAKLQATNTGLMATSGTINLIAGPINIPP